MRLRAVRLAILVVPPTDNGVVALNGTGVMRTRLEVSIDACQRVSLPEVVVSTAGHSAVGR